jgi:hypothetical protein
MSVLQLTNFSKFERHFVNFAQRICTDVITENIYSVNTKLRVGDEAPDIEKEAVIRAAW